MSDLGPPGPFVFFSDIGLEKQPLFDNRKQSVSMPESVHFQPTYTEPLKKPKVKKMLCKPR